VGLRPSRVLDTRPHAVLEDATVAIDLRGLVPPRSTAASLSVTATETRADGFVTVHPCGGGVPTVSNLNQRVGLDRANLVTVAMSTEHRVCVTSSSAGALVVDLVGAWIDDPTGDRLEAEVVPVRAIDTRTSGNRLVPGTVRELLSQRDGVVFANVTVDRTGAAGWLAVFPCDDGFTGTSTVNYAAASSASTAVVVDAMRGGVCAVASAPTDVIVDVFATAASP
jgi:hypothetical protein